jgi:hypothetical protein
VEGFLVVIKRRTIFAVLLPLLTAAPSFAQSGSALTVLLNKYNLTPVPAGLSTYKPGTLIVLRAGSIPDPKPLDPVVAALTSDPATATIPASTITTADDYSVAATLTGWTVKPSVAHGTSLQTDKMILSGWVLNDADYAAILDPNSKTFAAAKAIWTNRLGFRNSKLYVIDSVYTTTHVNISTSNDTDITVNGSCDPAASAKSGSTNNGDVSAKPGPTTPTAPGKTPATPGTAPAAGGQSNSTQNPVAADVQAVGNAAGTVIGDVMGKSGGAGTTSKTIASIFSQIAPGVSVCHTSKSSVAFDSNSPVPVAMILKEVSFSANFGQMNLVATVAKW